MDRNLRAFLAIARTGSLTAASAQVGLTQPALTKTIRRLEEEFGERLLRREARGMSLTLAGRLLFERARAIETHFIQAREEIRAIRSDSVETFKIVAGSAYHASVGPTLVRSLSQEFPRTQLLLSFEMGRDTLPALAEGRVDLVLGALRDSGPDGILSEKLVPGGIAVFSCPTNPLAVARRVTPEQFAGRGWVTYLGDRMIMSELGTFFRGRRLPEPRIVMEADSILACFGAMRDTPYLFAGSAALRTIAEQRGIVRIDLASPVWEFDSGAMYREASLRYPTMRRALEIVRALTADWDRSSNSPASE